MANEGHSNSLQRVLMRGARTRRGMRFVRESEFGTTPVLIPKRLVFFFYTTLNGRLSKRVPFTEPVNGSVPAYHRQTGNSISVVVQLVHRSCSRSATRKYRGAYCSNIL